MVVHQMDDPSARALHRSSSRRTSGNAPLHQQPHTGTVVALRQLVTRVQAAYWTYYLRLEAMAKSDPDYEQTRRVRHRESRGMTCDV